MLSHDLSDSNGHSEMVTKAAMAKRLGVCEKTVERLASRRIIPFIKFGRSVRFRPDEVEEHIARYWTFRPLRTPRKRKASKSRKNKGDNQSPSERPSKPKRSKSDSPSTDGPA